MPIVSAASQLTSGTDAGGSADGLGDGLGVNMLEVDEEKECDSEGEEEAVLEGVVEAVNEREAVTDGVGVEEHEMRCRAYLYATESLMAHTQGRPSEIGKAQPFDIATGNVMLTGMAHVLVVGS